MPGSMHIGRMTWGLSRERVRVTVGAVHRLCPGEGIRCKRGGYAGRLSLLGGVVAPARRIAKDMGGSYRDLLLVTAPPVVGEPGGDFLGLVNLGSLRRVFFCDLTGTPQLANWIQMRDTVSLGSPL